MSAIGLDELLPRAGAITSTMVERWIAASLAQCAALHEHDRWLYPHDPADMPMSERLHAGWRSWVDDAEALLRRAETLAATGRVVPGLDGLRDAVGRALAVIQNTPAQIACRREQAQRGEVYSIEEVRRELRLGVRR